MPEKIIYDLLELSKDQYVQIKNEILVETLDGLYRKYTLPCSLTEIDQNQKIVNTLKEFLKDPLNNPESHGIVFHNPDYGKFLEYVLKGKDIKDLL